MSLLNSTSSQVGVFTHLEAHTLNGPQLLNFGGGSDADVLTFDKTNNSWWPQPPAQGTNVYVNPVTTNAPFFLTLVPQDTGSQPVKTNVALTYNPGTTVLTVPFVDGTASSSVDSLNSVNVGVTDNTAANVTVYPTFVQGNTGNQAVQVDSTGLTYNPSTNTLSSALFSGSLVNVVTINGLPYPQAPISLFPIGYTLTVDQVYGDDAKAAATPASRFAYPFKTLQAALTLLPVNYTNIRVNPGTYTLVAGLLGVPLITLPADVCLTGASTQCVLVEFTGAAVNTTMVSMGANTRIENMTFNLSSSNAVSLTGVTFPSTTSLTAKLRSTVWNVTSTNGGANSVVGVLSAGTSSLDYSGSDAIARSTINVSSSGTGVTRGLLVQSDNRFGIRDTVINASGTGSNIIGVESNVLAPGITVPYVSLKTSTVRGVLADVSRTAGTILVGFTDFVNNKANGKSFSVVTEASQQVFAVLNNLGNNTTHNLVPGTFLQNQLPMTSLNIPVTQNMILTSASIAFVGTLGGPIHVDVYQNNTQVYTITLDLTLHPTGVFTQKNISVDFYENDTYHATVTTTGNGNNGTFSLTLAFY